MMLICRPFVQAKPRVVTSSPVVLGTARQLFDKISGAQGHKSKDDWYQERNIKGLVAAHGGASILVTHFRNSPTLALKAVYPEHTFLDWRFTRVGKAFWDDAKTHRSFFDWAAGQLGFDPNTDWDNWYSISRRQVYELGGDYLLVRHYGSSVSRAVTGIYMEHPWDMTKFGAVRTSYWDDTGNVRLFFEKLGTKLGVQKLEDWYILGTVQAISAAGGPFFAHNDRFPVFVQSQTRAGSRSSIFILHDRAASI